MSIDQSTFLDYTTLLSKHKQNEILYKQKIKQLNLTRSKISDQFELLQQTYDKKMKTLENKLESLKTQNQQLIKQNLIYKADIQNYQSRLVEKEKIIGVLLGQKNSIVVSSDRSKSQKTESLNAHEDENGSKFNKKTYFNKDKNQVQSSKSKVNVPVDQKVKEESKVTNTPIFSKEHQRDSNEKSTPKKQNNVVVQIKNKSNHSVQQKTVEHNGKDSRVEQKQKKNIQNNNIGIIKEQSSNFMPVERLTLTQKKQKQQNSYDQEEEQIEPQIIPQKSKNRSPPPPPPAKAKSKIISSPHPSPPAPPIKKKKILAQTPIRPFYQAQDQQQVHQAAQYDNKNQSNHQNIEENHLTSFQKHHHHQDRDHIQEKKIYLQQHEHQNQPQIYERQNEHKSNTYHQEVPVQFQPQSPPSPNFLHHFKTQTSQQNDFPSYFNGQSRNNYQAQPPSSPTQGNILQHFTKSIEQITTQPYGGAKVFNRNKKKKKVNQMQDNNSQNASKHINKSDIYSQLNEKQIKKDKKNDSRSYVQPNLYKQNMQYQENQPSTQPQPLKYKFQDIGNANDFFKNFNQDYQEQSNHFEILQSSIDHIERDSSIISNQQPYFADMNVAHKQKPIKMPKKKGKRDQIKEMNPSMFQ